MNRKQLFLFTLIYFELRITRDICFRKGDMLVNSTFFAVTQYWVLLAQLLDNSIYFTNPKILGHACTKKILSSFLKIYGDE
jgi:hypothetical protein